MGEVVGIILGVLLVSAVAVGLGTFANDAAVDFGKSVNLTSLDQSDAIISDVKSQQEILNSKVTGVELRSADIIGFRGIVDVLGSVLTSSVSFFFNLGSVMGANFGGIIPVKFTNIFIAIGVIILVFAIISLFLKKDT